MILRESIRIPRRFFMGCTGIQSGFLKLKETKMRNIVFCYFLLLFLAFSCPCDSDPVADRNSPVVTTKSGPVRGKLVQIKGWPNSDVYAFTGIPFAEPPVGQRRFRRPVPLKPWNSSLILDATKTPNECVQSNGNKITDFFLAPTAGSEDCLYLNIWVPKYALDAVLSGSKGTLLSTYIFIHGGAFLGGSASFHNGSVLAGLNSIVVAAIQYRLGSLGFAYLGTEDAMGNMGMWDQLEAMKWLFENIGSFGGNNSEITLGGQSAGAASVAFHLLSPHSRKYFQRAIIQSGASISPWATHTPQQAANATDIMFEQVATKICNQTGTVSAKSPASEKARCLMKADASIFPRVDIAPALSGFGIPFVPIIDGDFLPRDPYEMLRAGDYHKIPLLIGANKDEGSPFLAMSPEAAIHLPTPDNQNKTIDTNLNFTHYKTMISGTFNLFLSALQPLSPLLLNAVELHYWPQKSSGFPRGPEIVDALSNMVGDNSLLCPTYALAHEAATFSKNIYAYYFTHRRYGETIPEWMGVAHSAEMPYVFGDPIDQNSTNRRFSNEDTLLSYVIMSYWTNFIKYGNPNGIDRVNVAAKNGMTLRDWPSHIGDECKNRIFEINFAKQVYGAGEATICDLKARDCSFWQDFYLNLMRTLSKRDQNSGTGLRR